MNVKKQFSLKIHQSPIYRITLFDEFSFFSFGADGVVMKSFLDENQPSEKIGKMEGSIFSGLTFNNATYIGENHVGLHKNYSEKHHKFAPIEGRLFEVVGFGDKIIIVNSLGELWVYTVDLVFVKKIKLSSEHLRTIEIAENKLIVSGSDNVIRILNSNFEVESELKGHLNSVFSLAYHPKVDYLISAGREAKIKIWKKSSSTFELVEDIPAHLFSINHVVFSPCGRFFASASMDKTIKIWDAHNFKLLKVIEGQRDDGHKSSVNRLIWFEYRNLLVSCSDDRTISGWKIDV